MKSIYIIIKYDNNKKSWLYNKYNKKDNHLEISMLFKENSEDINKLLKNLKNDIKRLNDRSLNIIKEDLLKDIKFKIHSDRLYLKFDSEDEIFRN